MDGNKRGELRDTVRSVRVLAVMLAASAVLAGCGGSSAQPRSLPSAPSALPSPTASAAPSAINAPTPEGAAAFARFFYAEITRAFATRNPDLIQAISLPSCKACELYRASVANVRAEKETVKGGAFEITFAVAPAEVSTLTQRVDVGWNFLGASFFDASGRVVESHPVEHGVEEQLQLRRSSTGWIVAAVTRTRIRQ